MIVLAPARRSRGNTILELALVLPILITLILYSLFFTDLIRAKLKLQEAARYEAWEATSYPLSDYGSGRAEAAFETASTAISREAETRYRELDSVEGARHSGFVSRFEMFHARITQTEVSLGDASGQGLQGKQRGGWSNAVLAPWSSGAGRVLKGWGFNMKGRVRAEVSGALVNRLLPQHFLDRPGRGLFHIDLFGGQNLARLSLTSRLTLIADGWALPDGADAVMKGLQAGQHRDGNQPSGLRRQVRRMSFLGLREKLENVPAVSSVLGLLRSAAPDPLGTFVVSHNYAPTPRGQWSRDCNNPEYPQEAVGGLNNLSKFSKLDNDRPRCFDTAPFRDQASYEDSLYLQMFRARGAWFMGCKNDQADDPSSKGNLDSGDESLKVHCE